MNPSVPSEILEALRNAVQQDTEIRLVARGKTPGLFKGRVKQETVKKCLDDKLGLFTVTRTVTDEPGGQTTHFVVVASGGLELLFEEMPSDQHAEFIEQVAPRYKILAAEISASIMATKIRELNSKRRLIQEQEDRLILLLQQTIKECRKTLMAEREQIEKALQNLELPDLPKPTPHPEPKRDRVPRTEEDLDFQRDVAEELVYAWQDAENPESRQALERVMRNAGLEGVGEVDEVVRFDGRLHLTDDPLDVGDSAVVRQPGWRLVNSRGRFLIIRARVEKIPSNQEVPHGVSHD